MLLRFVKVGQIFLFPEVDSKELSIYKKIESPQRNVIIGRKMIIQDGELEDTEIVSFFDKSFFDFNVGIYKHIEKRF